MSKMQDMQFAIVTKRGCQRALGVKNRLIGKWPGCGSDEDFDSIPPTCRRRLKIEGRPTPRWPGTRKRDPSTERTFSCTPSDRDSPTEPPPGGTPATKATALP